MTDVIRDPDLFIFCQNLNIIFPIGITPNEFIELQNSHNMCYNIIAENLEHDTLYIKISNMIGQIKNALDNVFNNRNNYYGDNLLIIENELKKNNTYNSDIDFNIDLENSHVSYFVKKFVDALLNQFYRIPTMIGERSVYFNIDFICVSAFTNQYKLSIRIYNYYQNYDSVRFTSYVDYLDNMNIVLPEVSELREYKTIFNDTLILPDSLRDLLNSDAQNIKSKFETELLQSFEFTNLKIVLPKNNASIHTLIEWSHEQIEIYNNDIYHIKHLSTNVKYETNVYIASCGQECVNIVYQLKRIFK